MSAEEGGVPDVPDVQVEDPHVKVGDGMDDDGRFIVGQIAVVTKGQVSCGSFTPGNGKPGVVRNKTLYDIVFFDTAGREHGRLHLVGL